MKEGGRRRRGWPCPPVCNKRACYDWISSSVWGSSTPLFKSKNIFNAIKDLLYSKEKNINKNSKNKVESKIQKEKCEIADEVKLKSVTANGAILIAILGQDRALAIGWALDHNAVVERRQVLLGGLLQLGGHLLGLLVVIAIVT